MRVANSALEDFHVKNCSKIVFFPLGAEIPVLELQFVPPLRVILLCFATSCLQIEVE